MTLIDVICIVCYFALVGFIAWWSGQTSRQSSRSYFLGGGHIGWLAIGASLFATNISAEHFIGLAGTGASSGLAVGQFEWLACLILLLLGYFFAPYYLRTGIFTMPEFLEKRFDARARNYLSAVSLIAYVFTKVSVAVYAGALVLRTIVGWDIYIGAVLLIVVTGLYTATGGLRAVIYTDFFQAFVLIAGGLLLTIIALFKVGGPSGLLQQVPPDFFNLWKGVHHSDFPWTGILFGAPILGIWYWCTDQVVVQRTLASQNIEDAKKACVFAGYLKILPVFILVLPGVCGAILFPEVSPNEMYATLVTRLLPPGVKGFVMAGLLAALMSSLSSVFNSSSTLVVMDFYKKKRPDATEKQLVRAGQIATAVLVVVSLLWLPFIGLMSNQLYIYLQSVQAYISPPITAVFVWGLLSKRVTSNAAISVLILGFLLGAFRFGTEIAWKAGALTHPVLVWYAGMNFLHFALFLFIVSSVALFALSYLQAESTVSPSAHKVLFPPEQSSGKRAKPFSFTAMAAWILVLSVLAFWLIFSPIFFKAI